MGYTGHIKINEETILQEWKSSNTYFGQSYATSFLRSQECELTLDSLYETLGDIFGSRYDMAGEADRQITYSTQMIHTLRGLISNSYVWNKNYVLEREVFVNDKGEIGFGRVIKGELKTENATILGSDIVFRFAFGDSLNNEKLGAKYYEELSNKKTVSKLYLIEMVEALCEIQKMCFNLYSPVRNQNEYTVKVLKGFVQDIEAGDKLTVKFSPDHKNALQVYSEKKNAAEYFGVNEELYYNLFAKNNLYQLGAYCEIKTKQKLKELIDSFAMAKKRNPNIEEKIIDFYNSITDEDDFVVDISGSF